MRNPLKWKKNRQDDAFIEAARTGDLAVVTEMIKAGQDVNVLCKAGFSEKTTALMTAISFNNTSIALALIEAGADVNLKDGYGRYPLVEAVYRGNAAVVERMVKAAGVNPDVRCDADAHSYYGAVTALECAFYRGRDYLAVILIEAGAKPVVRDKDNQDQSLFFPVIRREETDVFDALLAKGHHLLGDMSSITPLEYAIQMNRDSMAVALLDAGVSPVTKDPVLLSLIGAGRLDLAAKLDEKGADATVTDASGKPASLLLERAKEAEQRRRDEEAARERKLQESLEKAEEERRVRKEKIQSRGYWQKTSDEEVSRTKHQPALARHLKDVFNFRTRERLSVVIDPKTEKVEALTITGFDQMTDKTLLEEALEEFQKQGGTADRSVLRGPVLSRAPRPLMGP